MRSAVGMRMGGGGWRAWGWGVAALGLLGCGIVGDGSEDASGDTGAEGGTVSASGVLEGDDGATSTSAGSADGTEDASGGSTGASLPAGCLPADVHGAGMPELSVPGLNVYEGCEGEVIVVEHLGSSLLTTVDEIDAVREEGTLFPGTPPGLFAVGTGMCCGDPGQICVVLSATEDTPLAELVATIDAAFPESDASCFGVTVSYGEPPVLE